MERQAVSLYVTSGTNREEREERERVFYGNSDEKSRCNDHSGAGAAGRVAGLDRAHDDHAACAIPRGGAEQPFDGQWPQLVLPTPAALLLRR